MPEQREPSDESARSFGIRSVMGAFGKKKIAGETAGTKRKEGRFFWGGLEGEWARANNSMFICLTSPTCEWCTTGQVLHVARNFHYFVLLFFCYWNFLSFWALRTALLLWKRVLPRSIRCWSIQRWRCCATPPISPKDKNTLQRLNSRAILEQFKMAPKNIKNTLRVIFITFRSYYNIYFSNLTRVSSINVFGLRCFYCQCPRWPQCTLMNSPPLETSYLERDLNIWYFFFLIIPYASSWYISLSLPLYTDYF